MKRPTFAQARAHILQALKAAGWDVHLRSSTGRDLKVPYAVSPNNGFRIDFKAQAVYDHHAELSLWLDIREPHALKEILARGEQRRSVSRDYDLGNDYDSMRVKREFGENPVSTNSRARSISVATDQKLSRFRCTKCGGACYGIGQASSASKNQETWKCDTCGQKFVKKQFDNFRNNPVKQSGIAFDDLRAGDVVKILSPHKQILSGVVVMRGKYGWVLNMGGRHGTPGIVSPQNFVSARRGKRKANPEPPLTLRQAKTILTPLGVSVAKSGSGYTVGFRDRQGQKARCASLPEAVATGREMAVARKKLRWDSPTSTFMFGTKKPVAKRFGSGAFRR